MTRSFPLLLTTLTLACVPEPHALSEDQDGDGFVGFDDCDDTRADIYPNATEVCDGIDNDCDGLVDDEDTYLDESTQSAWYTDADEDGFGDPDAQVLSCQAPSGTVADDQDCDDTTADAHPDATEICDDIDNDCDGLVDDEDDSVDLDSVRSFYMDTDGDGYGDPDQTIESCSLTSGVSESGDDCDDGDAELNPGASDTVGDDIDQDCDGLDGVDADGDGYASEASGGDDCDDSDSSVYTGAEDTVSDAIDQNCDGIDGVDADADGYASEASGGDDCDDADADRNAGATDDVGDGVDQNCDDLDGVDADADGYASEDSGGDDCDDTDYDVNPLAPETDGDGVDSDCDGDDDIYDPDTVDADGDSYSIADGDCDDENPAINPMATDIVGDGYDQNCDGIDGTDVDGDGYASEASGGDDCEDLLSDVNPDGTEVVGDELDNDCEGSTDWVYLEEANGTFTGENSGDYAGMGLSSAGDLDGDGYHDIVIGAPYLDNGSDLESGGAYVFQGPVSGNLAVTEADTILTGENAYDYFGGFIRGDADFDGDGYDDLLITAWGHDDYGSDTDAVYLLSGPFGSAKRLSGATALIVGSGEHNGDLYAIGYPGDINGDGYDDLVAAAPFWSVTGSAQGRAYVVYGPISGTGTSIETLADFVVTGDSSNYIGYTTAANGDLDGDGFNDIGINSPYFRNGTEVGALGIMYGPVSGSIDFEDTDVRIEGDPDETAIMRSGGHDAFSISADTNGDGYDDVIVGHPDLSNTIPNSGAAYVFLGPIISDIDITSADAQLIGGPSEYAGTSVTGLDDFNGDGIDDLLIGAPYADSEPTAIATDMAGATYLMFGPISGTINLQDDSDGRFMGIDFYEESGRYIANAGDTNGDGLGDLLIGSAYKDSYTGAAYLILGNSP